MDREMRAEIRSLTERLAAIETANDECRRMLWSLAEN
jgi:hypothetical protein